MAATGGDTIVPTNWSGLIGVMLLIGVIAAATYFGLEFTADKEVKTQTEEKLSVQEVFSASSKREIAAAEPVRALSRADFAASNDSDMSYGDSGTSSDDWDAPAQTGEDYADAQASDDSSWSSASSDDSDDEDSSSYGSSADDSADDDSSYQSSSSDEDSDAPTSAARYEEAEPAVRDSRARPDAEALIAWWKDAGDGLAVRFAGTLDTGGTVSNGVAVMFGEAVAPDQGDQYLELTDSSGSKINGRWKRGNNPTLLLMEGLSVGRYTLTIASGLTGESGKPLANTVSGPVYVY